MFFSLVTHLSYKDSIPIMVEVFLYISFPFCIFFLFLLNSLFLYNFILFFFCFVHFVRFFNLFSFHFSVVRVFFSSLCSGIFMIMNKNAKSGKKFFFDCEIYHMCVWVSLSVFVISDVNWKLEELLVTFALRKQKWFEALRNQQYFIWFFLFENKKEIMVCFADWSSITDKKLKRII